MASLSHSLIMFGLVCGSLFIAGVESIHMYGGRSPQTVTPAPIKTPEPSHDDIKSMWKRYRKDRSIGDDSRFDAFKENVLQAHERNNQHGVNCTDFFEGTECIFGITKFAHMTQEEFAAQMLHKRSIRASLKTTSPGPTLNKTKYETSVDWRDKGALTPVKDQGNCGSCYAFAATEQIESAVWLATGSLDVLSTEQIVDCDTANFGCAGGITEWAIDYAAKAGGLSKAVEYPDTSSATGASGACHASRKPNNAANHLSWHYATAPCFDGACSGQDEDDLAWALAEGPLAVAVHADDWMLYMHGIYSMGCTSSAYQLDHAVQLVGYNDDAAVPYWIVRNSWSTDWGDNGYIYLAKGGNLCGIADSAVAVTAS